MKLTSLSSLKSKKSNSGYWIDTNRFLFLNTAPLKKQITALGITFILLFSFSGYSQNQDVTYINLLGETLFPEGILHVPNGDLLVGGFGDGSIQRINQNKEASYFSPSGANGMHIAVGMALDKTTNRLWVANFNFSTESGSPGSNLKVFDVTNGKLLKTIPENFIEGVFFNEVTIGPSGDVYVSNTFGPQIYTTDFEKAEASIFVQNDLLSNPAEDQPFDLNGLTITPDGKYLIASVMDRLDPGDGRLVRIDLSTQKVSEIALNGSENAIKAFAGSDGMIFHNQTLYMVNVYAKAGAIITATFNENFTEATLGMRTKLNHIYDRPTSLTIADGRLYTVNSQLNHIIDDADGELNTPPILPFNIVSTPLNQE